VVRISEARSNPDRNTKESSLVSLTKYAGQSDIFVSFTSGFSQGSDYTGRKEVKSNKLSQHKIGINPKSSYETPLGIYTYPVDYVIKWSAQRGKLTAPYTGRGEWGFLYVLRRQTNKVIDDKTNMEPFYRRFREYAITVTDEDTVDEIVGQGIATASVGSPMNQFWNYTRLFANNHYDKIGAKTAAVAWNVVLRRSGVEAIVDDNNSGTIHPSEPTQAVFMTSSAFSVVDVIYRDHEKRENPDSNYLRRYAESIKGRNKNIIDPLMITKVFAQGFSVSGLSAQDIKWVSDNIGTIGKKMVADVIFDWKSWPHEMDFSLEMTQALRSFGGSLNFKVLSHQLDMANVDLVDYEKFSGRPIGRTELSDILSRNPTILYNTKLSPKMIMLLLDVLASAKWHRLSYGQTMRMIDKAGIPVDAEIGQKLFVIFPRDVLRDATFPIKSFSFQDWYRGFRVQSHFEGDSQIDYLWDALPPKYITAIVLAMLKQRQTIPTKAVDELCRNHTDFTTQLLTNSAYSELLQGNENINKIIQDNIYRLFRSNPSIYNIVDKSVPDSKLINIARQMVKKHGYYNVLVEMIQEGWISSDQFSKWIVFPADKTLVSLAGYFINPVPELKLKVAMFTDKWKYLTNETALLLFDTHPELIPQWDGVATSRIADEMVRRHPTAVDNDAVLAHLSLEMIFHTILNGRGDLYSKLPSRTKVSLIASALANPLERKKMQALLLDSDSFLYPSITMLNSEQRSVWDIPLSLVEPLLDHTIPDQLASILLRAYVQDIYGRITVSDHMVRRFAAGTPTAIATKKVFTNPIPEDVLTKAQLATIDIAIPPQTRKETGDDVFQHVIGLFYQPTREVLELFADHLKPQ